MIPSSGDPNLPPIIAPGADATPLVPRWRWWVHLLLLAAYPLVIGGLSLVGSGRAQPALSSTVKGLLIISAVELGVFGAIFSIAWMFSRASREQLLLARRLQLREIPLSALYSVGLRIGVVLIAGLIAAILTVSGAMTFEQVEEFVSTNRPEVEALVDVSALQKNPLYLILNATLVSFVVAGFREELWRAGVLAGLRRLWPGRFDSLTGQLVAVSIAAVLFGLGHFSQGAFAAFLTALLGFMLGAIMVFHKSIWPAVLAHGAFNATTFVALPWISDHLAGTF